MPDRTWSAPEVCLLSHAADARNGVQTGSDQLMESSLVGTPG